MDANLVRDTLGRLLADENAALGEFETLLEREHGALSSRDIDALESLAETRQANVIRLLKIEDERRALCSLHGYDADLSGLSKLIAWCDPARTLAKPYEECAALAKRCRDINDRNGVLVGAQMKRVEGLLSAMTGAADGPPRVYGPRTNSNPYAAPGRVISAEA